jgi:hypothetical protein
MLRVSDRCSSLWSETILERILLLREVLFLVPIELLLWSFSWDLSIFDCKSTKYFALAFLFPFLRSTYKSNILKSPSLSFKKFNLPFCLTGLFGIEWIFLVFTGGLYFLFWYNESWEAQYSSQLTFKGLLCLL